MREKTAKKVLKQVKHSYNLIADDFSRTRSYIGKEFELFTPYIKNNSTIVDLGCGNGRLANFIKDSKLPVKYMGIDNNENFLKIAKKKYPKEKFIIGDQLKIPLEKETTDVLLNIRSFHHLPSKKMRLTALAEMKRILKKEGILIISVWDLWQRKYLKALVLALFRCVFTLGNYDYNDTFIPWGKTTNRYYHAFTARELKKIVEKAGFTILKTLNFNNDHILIAQK